MDGLAWHEDYDLPMFTSAAAGGSGSEFTSQRSLIVPAAPTPPC
jgi:hypothetical protein